MLALPILTPLCAPRTKDQLSKALKALEMFSFKYEYWEKSELSPKGDKKSCALPSNKNPFLGKILSSKVSNLIPPTKLKKLLSSKT